MLLTIDFNRYDELTYQRQTDSSNCYSIYTSIKIIRNYNDAYFLLKTHTDKRCFKELQIKYKSENNEERGKQ